MEMNAKSKKLFEAFLVGLRDEVSHRYLKKKDIRHKWLERLGMDNSCPEKTLYFPDGMQLACDRDQIREIDKALRRIQSDSYCICESCGGIIPEWQLSEMVLPWPTRCEECERSDGKGVEKSRSLLRSTTQDLPDALRGEKSAGHGKPVEVIYETGNR